MKKREQRADRVRLLDADPQLGACLTREELPRARRFVVAETVRLRRGNHDPAGLGSPDLLGLLVLDGLMVSVLEVAGRRCEELIAPGTLLRPWDHCAHTAPIACDLGWRAREPATIALLDERVTFVCARWPAVLDELTRRSVERCHRLALTMAICSLQHVEIRLLVLFWHLADRFGKVTSEGTVVPLKLSHSDLAGLIGAQRATASAKLAGLCDQGRLSRRSDRTWVLHGEPPQQLHDIRARARYPMLAAA